MLLIEGKVQSFDIAVGLPLYWSDRLQCYLIQLFLSSSMPVKIAMHASCILRWSVP